MSQETDDERSPSRNRRLTRERIIAVARELVAEAPGKHLSMRGLAQRLDVAAPSLYWHFANRAELIAALSEELFDQVTWPPDTGDWRTDARAVAHQIRAAMLNELGRDIAPPAGLPPTVQDAAFGRFVTVMRSAGCSDGSARQVARMLLWHALGYAAVERGVTWRRADADSRTYIIDEDFTGTGSASTFNADELFDSALTHLLNGIAKDIVERG